MERLTYLLAVFWIFLTSATFGQNAISFTSPSGQGLPLVPPLPPLTITPTVVFAPPPAPISAPIVLLPGTPVPPLPNQQQFTVHPWDNQGGPTVSWDVRLDAALFSLPHPPISFLYPIYGVPDFDTMMRLSGQSDATSVNAVPEPGSVLLFVAGGLAFLAVRVRRP